MDENKNQKKAKFKGIGLTTLGWEIALPIFGGVILGFYLDRWLKTTYMFTLSLLGLGIMIGYYNIYKRIEIEMLRKKLSDDQKNKENQEE
ncbi:MAG: AtpZ/AtpI family protein [Brevefilum sp.]